MSKFLCPSCETWCAYKDRVGDVCPNCTDAIQREREDRQEAAENLGLGYASPQYLLSDSEKAEKEEQEKTSAQAKELAQRELAQRELARRKLLPFVMRNVPAYMPGWVHQDIATRLEQFSRDVAAMKSPRLMLFLPPRHGKSEIASRNFPAWHLGHYPEHEIIACSYASALALKFSRKVREVLRSKEYSDLFPDTQLSPDTQSLESWLTQAGGGYMAAGVGGPITGNGAHVLLIDDPVKNREEADSETSREAMRDWYTSTAYTRLAPGGGVLLILTRWHHDDLAGWLLEEEKRGGDKWDVISYPARALEDERYRKAGDPLHEARYDSDALERIERVVGPRDWEALYQQRPTNDEGGYFRRPWFKTYTNEELPARKDMVCYTAWDLAIGQGQENDYTVGITIGVDNKDQIWVLDLMRMRGDSLEIADAILDMHETWRAERVGIEHGQISMAIGPLLQRRIAERNLYDFPMNPTKDGLKVGRRDKQARARPIQGRMQQEMVLFPAHEPWFHGLRSEMLNFPNAAHDDQVDAMAWIGQMLSLFHTPVHPAARKKKSWRDRLERELVGARNKFSGSGMGA